MIEISEKINIGYIDLYARRWALKQSRLRDDVISVEWMVIAPRIVGPRTISNQGITYDSVM